MLPEWLEKIATGGPAAIFAVMWWLERNRAESEREEHKTIARDTINSLIKLESTLAAIGNVFTSRPNP